MGGGVEGIVGELVDIGGEVVETTLVEGLGVDRTGVVVVGIVVVVDGLFVEDDGCPARNVYSHRET